MSEILLSNQVLIYLLSEGVLAFLLLIAFVSTVYSLVYWDFDSFSPRQFALERRAYLVMTILLFVFVVKFFLIVYFVFAIDKLSLIVPGAMCAAGVVSANGYGMTLLLIKLVILFFLLLWMSLNRYDLEAKNYPVFSLKSWLFVLIFGLVVAEGWLDITYFTHIDIHKPVSCCSALFGQLEGANPLPFGLNISRLLILYYLLFAVSIASIWLEQRVVALMALVLFMVVGYYSVVYFFGTYVYELPTHKCPFCMMQKEYYFVGYLIWGTLFVGGFFGIVWSMMGLYLGKNESYSKRASLILLSVFVLICSTYVSVYYLKNGVLL